VFGLFCFRLYINVIIYFIIFCDTMYMYLCLTVYCMCVFYSKIKENQYVCVRYAVSSYPCFPVLSVNCMSLWRDNSSWRQPMYSDASTSQGFYKRRNTKAYVHTCLLDFAELNGITNIRLI